MGPASDDPGSPEDRCRLVLMMDGAASTNTLADALAGGDVASVILAGHGPDGAERLGELVALVQGFGAAAIVAIGAGSGEKAGDADGVHVAHGATPIPALRQRLSDAILGVGTQARDAALEAGEAGADYVFFGRLLRDTHAEPHPKLLDLARWWAEAVTVPCIVPGGTDLASVVAVAEAGADFVALHSAIFAADRPGDAVRRANALLDEHAPRFE